MNKIKEINYVILEICKLLEYRKKTLTNDGIDDSIEAIYDNLDSILAIIESRLRVDDILEMIPQYEVE